jgi:hypothetical protein
MGLNETPGGELGDSASEENSFGTGQERRRLE